MFESTRLANWTTGDEVTRQWVISVLRDALFKMRSQSEKIHSSAQPIPGTASTERAMSYRPDMGLTKKDLDLRARFIKQLLITNYIPQRLLKDFADDEDHEAIVATALRRVKEVSEELTENTFLICYMLTEAEKRKEILGELLVQLKETPGHKMQPSFVY